MNNFTAYNASKKKTALGDTIYKRSIFFKLCFFIKKIQLQYPSAVKLEGAFSSIVGRTSK
jgi:hypothetical protein